MTKYNVALTRLHKDALKVYSAQKGYGMQKSAEMMMESNEDYKRIYNFLVTRRLKHK